MAKKTICKRNSILLIGMQIFYKKKWSVLKNLYFCHKTPKFLPISCSSWRISFGFLLDFEANDSSTAKDWCFELRSQPFIYTSWSSIVMNFSIKCLQTNERHRSGITKNKTMSSSIYQFVIVSRCISSYAWNFVQCTQIISRLLLCFEHCLLDSEYF